MKNSLFNLKPVEWLFLLLLIIQNCNSYVTVSVCDCVCAAPGAFRALHEDERRAATQAGRAPGPAEEYRGEKGRHGGRPEGEKQGDRKSPRTAGQNEQQHPCMRASYTA